MTGASIERNLCRFVFEGCGGVIGSDGGSVRCFVRKLERPGVELRFCYEAGPTGYGLQRLIEGLGHECAVIAPSLIPRRPGERVKTNRRDAVKLARLCRAGELTEIWTPDEAHEAMRDLVRAREAAVKNRTRKPPGDPLLPSASRQNLSGEEGLGYEVLQMASRTELRLACPEDRAA